MRIAHVIARFNVGGTASWLSVLCHQLSAEGHDVVLLVGNVQEGEREDSSVESLPLQRVDFLGRSIAPYRDIRGFWDLRQAIQGWQPDIVNTHTAKAGLLGRIATRSLGSRPALVHTIHGHLLNGYFNKTAVAAITRSERQMAAISELVFASGKEVGAELVRVGAVPLCKLRIVHPGVHDVSRLSKNSAREQACPAETLQDRVVVGWLARITGIKRPDRLLEAARMNPEALFLVGGDGPLRTHLEAEAPSNVKFVGWTSPDRFWPACDIALLTSDNEAVPYSLIEAALASIPAVATDVGAVKSAILDGVTGILVPPDPQILGLAVRELLSDPERRSLMGQAARRFALSAFSPSAMAQQHLKYYREAVSLRDSRR